ncbi:hypothetical protein BDW62DRAFT_79123 [Aspergillus aurantiobrunneus]
MPPTFRSSRSGRQFNDGPNRTRTGQIDHDVFEGLPVRRWTRQVQTISQEPKIEGAESEVPGHGGRPTIPEHPMPRDSHLLSPMSRALLRAARSGCIYIRQASKDFEDEDKETTDLEDQQTQQNLERKFSMRKWTAVPKHLEGPEVEFLAKRRPGLPSLYGATAGTVDSANGSVPMRKTRFKKIDPVTGNVSIYAAWVPEGHKIEGEITDDSQLVAEHNQTTVTPEAPAPGTVIEGVGVVNAQGVVVAEAGSAAVLTPPKRRPPPPKRKGKGLKGRRKKVMFAPGEGADASFVHGTGAGDSAANYGKDTDSSRMSVDQTTQDDEDEEVDEGEESDDGEGDESGFDAKTPETPGPQPNTEPEAEPTPTPVPIKMETPIESQEVQAPETKPAIESLQTTPENIPAASSNRTNSATPDQPTETVVAAPVTGDVQMTDAMPEDDPDRPSSIPASETQPPATPQVAQSISVDKAPSPSRETQQPPVRDSSNVTGEKAELSSSEQPGEPIDVTMAEPEELDPEPPQAGPVNVDLSTEAPQAPFPDQTPENDSAPQQEDQQPGGHEFDLLDNLEASLDNVPKETSNDEVKETNPEGSSEEIRNQETTSKPESVALVQPPTEVPTEPKPAESTADTKEHAPEETRAPPIEQLTPPDAEQRITPNAPQQGPAAQQVPPSTEYQKPEHTPEAPTHPEPLPSNVFATQTESAQATAEKPKQKPQESGPEQASSKPPTLPETKAEPPTAEGPLQVSLSDPAPEQQVEQKAASSSADQEKQSIATSETTSQPPAEPIVEAAAEPTVESAAEQPQPTAQDSRKPVAHAKAESLPFSPAERALERQYEETQAGAIQELAPPGEDPSSNGEQQS